jgi:hypothetical protein
VVKHDRNATRSDENGHPIPHDQGVRVVDLEAVPFTRATVNGREGVRLLNALKVWSKVSASICSSPRLCRDVPPEWYRITTPLFQANSPSRRGVTGFHRRLARCFSSTARNWSAL